MFTRALTRMAKITALLSVCAVGTSYVLAHHVLGPAFDSAAVQDTLFTVVFPMVLGA